jgi:hypothetical protein
MRVRVGVCTRAYVSPGYTKAADIYSRGSDNTARGQRDYFCPRAQDMDYSLLLIGS